MNQPISAETGERNRSVADAFKRLNWSTVVLILVTGGRNLLATQQNSSQRQYQFHRAVEQIVDTWFNRVDALMQKWGGISRLQRIIEQLWLA
jgi:hypothetical protein